MSAHAEQQSYDYLNSAPGLPVAHIRLDRLRRNWEYLASLAGEIPPMALVKANAYGHGLAPVARALLDAGCRFFAVGGVAEGILLRKALSGLEGGNGASILPLLGILTERDARDVVAYNLVPLIHSVWQAALFSRVHTGPAPLPVAVKIETGMSRLGFRDGETAEFLAALRGTANLRPAYLLSHLASADDPAQDASVADQAARFLAVFRTMCGFWPDIVPSIANSPAFLARKELLPDFPPHLSRLGYAIYGGNPLAGTSRAHLGDALLPVMEVTAPVLAVHDAPKGARVSYGRTFTAPRDMRVAVVGAGYADGYSRGLSGRGRVCIRGESCPIVGRVCMQMFMADVTHVPDVAHGDDAYLLGGAGPGAVTMADLAAWWGTIPYEVFCLLGKNGLAHLIG